MERTISTKMYSRSYRGGTVMGSAIEIIGEEVYEIDGKVYEGYLYNIVGYTPKNGLPFIARKCNVIVSEEIREEGI